MKKRIVSFLLALIMVLGMLPVTAFASTSLQRLPNGSGIITSCNDISGSEVTKNAVLAKKLDTMFAGNIGLYANQACTNLINAALGTRNVPNNGVQQYWGNGYYSGTSCYAYACAFYGNLYDGAHPHHNVTANHQLILSPSGKISYENFSSWKVRDDVPVYIWVGSHGIIVLTYDSNYLVYADGNGDGNGLIAVRKEPWRQTTGGTNIYAGSVSRIVQPTTTYCPSADSSSDADSGLIKEQLPSYCDLKTTAATSIMSLPCSNGTDASSTLLESVSKGTSKTAYKLVLNKVGNYWYEVRTSSGVKGYIPSAKVSWVKDLIDVKITGAANPPNMVQGSRYTIQGTISANYNQLTEVSAYVYAGTDTSSGKEVTGSWAGVSNNSYSLANSSIDMATYFNNLSAGNYTYVVRAAYKNYYAKTETTAGYHTGSMVLQSSGFTVTSEATSTQPGKPVLKDMKSTYVEGEEVVFKWDATANTTHYNVCIQRKESDGSWFTVNDPFYKTSGYSMSLGSAEYRVYVEAGNSNASDWPYTRSDYVYFTVVPLISYDTYSLENVTHRTARVGGWLNNPLGATISSFGFIYGEKKIGEDSFNTAYKRRIGKNVAWTRAHQVYDLEEYIDLKANMEYFVQFYATVGSDTFYSDNIFFQTAENPVTFDGTKTGRITDYTAVIDTWFSNDWGLKLDSVGFYFGEKDSTMYWYEVSQNVGWTRANLVYNLRDYVGELKPSTMYQYQFAIKIGDETFSSDLMTFTTLASLPAPKLSISTDRSCGNPKLTWMAVEGSDQYLVFRRSSESKAYSLLGGTTFLTYTDESSDRVIGTKYYYMVIAINTDVSGAESNVVAHTYDHRVWVIDSAVEPTCTAPGLTIGWHCDACGTIIEEQQVVPAKGHTEVIDWAVAPTCTETGLTEGKHCSVCDKVLVAQKTVNALGHTEVIDEAMEPTCTETGLTEGSHCSVCSVIIVTPEVVAALDHNYGNWAISVEPTCIEVGEERRGCDRCDAFETREVEALGHTEVIDEAVAPTCTETGLAEGSHCSVCEEILIAQQVVDATGHHYSDPLPIENDPESGHWQKCDACGDLITDEHSYGSDTVCEVCSYPSGAVLWCAPIPDQLYTGAALKPEVDVYFGTQLLELNKDYTVSYKNNTNVPVEGAPESKLPTVTIKGKGNFAGTLNKTFTILPVDLASEAIVADESLHAAANEKGQKPKVTVSFGTKKLSTKDMAVTYYPVVDGVRGEAVDTCKGAGTWEIVLIGQGNYTGERTILLTAVEPAALISKATITLDPKTFVYDGTEKTPAVTVKLGKEVLVEGTDYMVTYKNNVAVGTATVVVTGVGDYAGTKPATFKITGLAINKVQTYNIPKSMMYTGEDITLDGYSLFDKTLGVFLTEGEDYTVSYDKNRSKGTATILFTGINGYTGTLKKTFKIDAYDVLKDIENSIEVEENIVASYMKGGAKPVPTITFNGKELVAGVDYTLAYKNNMAVVDADSAKAPMITITGKGNFVGKLTVNFSIEAKALSEVELIVDDKAYTPKATGLPTVTLTDTDGKKLAAGKDYDKLVSYTYTEDTFLDDEVTFRTAGDTVDKKDILPVGTVIRVTVVGNGTTYIGEASATYRIVPQSLAKATVKVANQQYTGKPIVPDKDDITVTVNKVKVDPENFEIVSCSNNVNKGSATLTIRGVGDNYGGVKTVKFKIDAKTMFWYEVKGALFNIFS